MKISIRRGRPLTVFVRVCNYARGGPRCRDGSHTTTAPSGSCSETRRARCHPHGATSGPRTRAARSSSAVCPPTSASSRSRQVSSPVAAHRSHARTGALSQDRRSPRGGLSHLQLPGALKGDGPRRVSALGGRCRRPRKVRRQVYRRT
jgi:hypothetical protein